MEDVYIVAAARTPIGAFNESLSSVSAHDLGSVAIQAVLKQAEVQPDQVSEVIMGQVLTAGCGQNPARQASIGASIPNSVPAWGLNVLCGSGMRAVVLGAQAIRLGDSQLVVAGGQESMSQAPHVLQLRAGVKLGDAVMKDSTLYDGLTDAFSDIHMGVTAENVVTKWGISREEQDKIAYESQMKTKRAIEAGYFTQEIVPVTVTRGRDTVEVSTDEFPKPGTTMESLARLRPIFKKDGTVTAGNATGINDGAAAVLLASGRKVTELGLRPLGRVVSWAQAGVDPLIMGTGPIPAVNKALRAAGWSKDDVDLFELNEPYAALSIAVVRELQVPADKVNVQGGAIALGHPIGSSGTRVLVTLLYALHRTGGRRGVAALCIGGGMGIAMCVEATPAPSSL